MNYNVRYKLFFLFSFLCGQNWIYGQDKNPPPPQKNPGAPGLQLPIDDYLPLLAILALLIGIYFTHKKVKAKTAAQVDA